jgi:hypothetical protein
MNSLLEHQFGEKLDALRAVQDRTAAGAAADRGISLTDVARGAALAPPPAPPSDAAEFEELIDRDMIRHAQCFFATFGLQVGAALLYHSLPDSYAAARGAQVLFLTGQLVSSPGRRVRETTQFVLTLMTPAPNGDPRVTTLHPGQPGAEAARRIRAFHQLVRNHIEADCPTRWQVRERYFKQVDPTGPPLGLPLNQEDLLGTLLEFTVAVFESLGALGVPYTADDEAAWFHVWDVVGRHMGIGTDSAFKPKGSNTAIANPMRPFLPLDRATASETLALIRRRHRLESPEGSTLVNALLAELQHPLPRGMKAFPASLMRYLLGAKTADVLGISRGGWMQELLFSLNSVPRIADTVARRRSGGLARTTTSELSAMATQRLLQSYLDQAPRHTPFDVSPRLRNAWGLGADQGMAAPAIP